ncbi:hypothetical protein RJ639_028953 [Escallonia herrerae]|uniref:Trichome birefringence-like C-terminal domain-containing protein n=1 Tax=Escallonia herrerae TaxID=1293975 RepID=A0AA88X635_9ASTE|nr:hypothetical protein RJ639_028953 [Escallonia herrerae]
MAVVLGGGNLLGCVYCSDPNVTDLALGFSLRMSYRAVLNYINECKDCKEGIVTIIRTFAPSHFENGFWNNGGSCNRTRPLPELNISWGSRFLELRSFQMEEIERFRRYVMRKKGGKQRFEVMDVTRATQMRPDGHPGLYLNWTKGYSDCLHWCLPGPIDAWNDFLLAILRKEMI